MAILRAIKKAMRRKSGKIAPQTSVSTRGGVFVSTRKLLSRKDSSTSIESESTVASRAFRWQSSGAIDHNKNVALVVSDPEHSVEIKDEAAELGLIMARSRHLPGTSYFSSNHIMVNEERSKRIIAPLVRLRALDEIAREYAERMAAGNSLFHSAPEELRSAFARRTRRFGENVARGENIRDMHKAMMKSKSDRNNILDRRYTHMGMATARGSDGRLYLCQIFRG